MRAKRAYVVRRPSYVSAAASRSLRGTAGRIILAVDLIRPLLLIIAF